MTPGPDPKHSLEQTCLFHLVALKYAMAGDLESDELLQHLETRWRLINWEDPEFIKFSDAMRNGPPHLISQTEETLVPELKAIVHDQGEQLASLYESAELIVKQHQAATKRVIPALNLGVQILTYIKDLIELCGSMRKRLHALGDDTSTYRLPRSPFPPFQ